MTLSFHNVLRLNALLKCVHVLYNSNNSNYGKVLLFSLNIFKKFYATLSQGFLFLFLCQYLKMEYVYESAFLYLAQKCFIKDNK